MERGEATRTPVEQTVIWLENYREMRRYVNNAVSEAAEVDGYNISAERAYLKTVRECKAETVILLAHIDKAMQALKEDAAASKELYKYQALESYYIKGLTYEQISRDLLCGRNSPKRWCRVMIQRLTIKLFGARAIDGTVGRVSIEVKSGASDG